MTVQPIYLQIPTLVERGLASGTLTRNAAGVVRATALHPDQVAGSIFGHLREVNGPSQIGQASAFVPAMATLALQAATLAYVKVRFDKIEAKLDALHAQGAELLSAVTQVRALQYLEFARPAAEALELLQRYGHGRRERLLDDAHRRFIQATGGLRQLLGAHSDEQLLGSAPQVERLFQVAMLCAAGEGQCLAFLEAPAEERVKSLTDHECLWTSVDRKLEAYVPTSRRFPTVDMLRNSPEANPNKTRARWQVESREAALVLRGEQAVIAGLQSLPQADVRSWSEGASRGEVRGLFVEATGQ